MKKNIIFFATLAMAGALVLSSCGKDEAEDSVSIDLPEMTVAADEESVTTTAGTETTTKSATTATKNTEPKTTTTATAIIGGGIVVGGEPGGASQDPTEAPNFEQPTEAPIPTTAPIQVTPKPVSFSYSSLLSNASNTVAALGAPNDTIYAQGCLSNGADQKIYKYNGIEISCYVMDGVEYIYDITITGGSYATAEGITVGSSRSAVESVYGAGEPAGNYVCYYSGDKELDIEYNGDTVVSIEYYTPV